MNYQKLLKGKNGQEVEAISANWKGRLEKLLVVCAGDDESKGQEMTKAAILAADMMVRVHALSKF